MAITHRVRAVLEDTLRCILEALSSHQGTCIQHNAAKVDLDPVDLDVPMVTARWKESLARHAPSITSQMVGEIVRANAQTVVILSSRKRRSQCLATALLAHAMMKAIQAMRTLLHKECAIIAHVPQLEVMLRQLLQPFPAQAVDVQVSPAHVHASLEFAIVPALSIENAMFHALLSHNTLVLVYRTRHIHRLHGLRGQQLKKALSSRLVLERR